MLRPTTAAIALLMSLMVGQGWAEVRIIPKDTTPPPAPTIPPEVYTSMKDTQECVSGVIADLILTGAVNKYDPVWQWKRVSDTCKPQAMVSFGMINGVGSNNTADMIRQNFILDIWSPRAMSKITEDLVRDGSLYVQRRQREQQEAAQMGERELARIRREDATRLKKVLAEK